MTRNSLLLTSKLFTGLTLFVLLTGARGCYTTAGHTSYTGYVDAPPTGGGATYVGGTAANASPYVALGDLSLTVYAPQYSSLTPDTQAFNVTVRDGGPFGPIVLAGESFAFDAYGMGTVDVAELPYGYYDVEVVGLDFFGNAVSYAAASLTLDAPLSTMVLELEPATYEGDVVLDLYEPDGGQFAGPIDTIDYALYEVDPVTNQLTLVEQMVEVPVSPFDSPMIPSLQLGSYYIEVDAYDVYGYRIYQFAADFDHQQSATFLPITFGYAN